MLLSHKHIRKMSKLSFGLLAILFAHHSHGYRFPPTNHLVIIYQCALLFQLVKTVLFCVQRRGCRKDILRLLAAYIAHSVQILCLLVLGAYPSSAYSAVRTNLMLACAMIFEKFYEKRYKWRINSKKIKICYFPLRFQYVMFLLLGKLFVVFLDSFFFHYRGNTVLYPSLNPGYQMIFC
jgi:hypothetical protein